MPKWLLLKTSTHPIPTFRAFSIAHLIAKTPTATPGALLPSIRGGPVALALDRRTVRREVGTRIDAVLDAEDAHHAMGGQPVHIRRYACIGDRRCVLGWCAHLDEDVRDERL